MFRAETPDITDSIVDGLLDRQVVTRADPTHACITSFRSRAAGPTRASGEPAAPARTGSSALSARGLEVLVVAARRLEILVVTPLRLNVLRARRLGIIARMGAGVDAACHQQRGGESDRECVLASHASFFSFLVSARFFRRSDGPSG